MMINGVNEYVTGALQISFPGEHPVCATCPLLERRHGIQFKCIFTGEILIYPHDEIGRLCPIKFEEDNHEFHVSPVEGR